MKIIITGKSGLLGSAAIKWFSKDENIIVKGIGRDDVDFNDIQTLYKLLENENAEVILHCAANTNVEFCETNPSDAYTDNYLLTERIASFCAVKNIKMVFISSTGNYGSKKMTPYSELDKVEPTTHYHKSKVLAETCVKEIVNKHLIIRTGWLFTSNPSVKKNFIKARVFDAESGKVMHSDGDQLGNPTYDLDLIETIDKLLKLDLFGVYNCVNTGVASRFDYVKEILNGFSLDTKLIKVPHTSFKRNAPVSLNESAINFKLEKNGINIMRPWKIALHDAIKSIKEDNT